MGLTRPRFEQLNTIVTTVSDPILVLNKGSTLADVDSGFIINRDGGISSNAAIIWQESTRQFVLGLTADSGAVNSNISIGSYANLRINTLTSTTASINNLSASGNITTSGYFLGNGSQLSGVITSVTKIISGTSDITAYDSGNIAISVGGTANTVVFTSSNIHITGSLIPTANLVYDLGSPTKRWRDAYFAGSTIYLGNAVLSSSGEDIIISTTGGFGVPVGSTAQRTTTQGAIRYNTTLSAFEAYDGATWNSLAYGTVSDFPSGDYGDVSTITSDAFGVPLATTYDCNSEGALTYEDFSALI